MPLDLNGSKPQPHVTAAASEQKARGALRSTKVAGKLKVLPEQPDSELVPPRKTLQIPPKDHETGIGSTGDSEEGDDEEEEDDAEDVQVCHCQLFPERSCRDVD
jgi:hypothetical protein